MNEIGETLDTNFGYVNLEASWAASGKGSSCDAYQHTVLKFFVLVTMHFQAYFSGRRNLYPAMQRGRVERTAPRNAYFAQAAACDGHRRWPMQVN